MFISTKAVKLLQKKSMQFKQGKNKNQTFFIPLKTTEEVY